MTEGADYANAKRRVSQLMGFYIHLLIYVMVNAGLALLNFQTTPDQLWFYWPLLGWGIGLGIHAITVFMASSVSDWQQKKIAEIAAKSSRAPKP